MRAGSGRCSALRCRPSRLPCSESYRASFLAPNPSRLPLDIVPPNAREAGRIAKHGAIGGVGERAVAFATLDAAAQLVRTLATPNRQQVVACFAQIAHGLRADAAGPDIAIGRDMAG